MKFTKIASVLLMTAMVAESTYAAVAPPVAMPVPTIAPVTVPAVTPSPVITSAVAESPGVVAEDSSIVIPDPATFANETDPVFKEGFGAGKIDIALSSTSVGGKDFYGLSGQFTIRTLDSLSDSLVLRNEAYADYEINWDLSPTNPAFNYHVYDGEGAPTNVLAPWTGWRPLTEEVNNREGTGPSFYIRAVGYSPVTSSGEQLAGFVDGQEVKVKVSLRNTKTGAIASWLITIEYIAPVGADGTHHHSNWGTSPSGSQRMAVIPLTNIVRVE